MYLAAGHHFYTSGTFWGVAVSVIVGALSIIATIWVTRLGASTKRCLYYTLLSDTPLLTGRQDLSEQLKVTYGNAELKSPRVVVIRLVSRGRADIAREAFDSGKPLILDLGTPIVDLVKVTTSPSDRSDPEWTLKDSELRVGPSHFGRRQKTEFSLLVDGKSPSVIPPKQTLLDVRIEPGDGETIRQEKFIRVVLRFAFSGLLLFLLGVIVHVLPVAFAGIVLFIGGFVSVFVVSSFVADWRDRNDFPTKL